jgi:hypothetical protein
MQIEESATQNIQINSTLEPSATVTQNLSQNNVETHTDVIMADHADESETPHPPCFPHFTIRKSSHRTKRPTPDSVTSDPQTPVNSKKQKKRLALSATVTQGYDLVRHTAQTSVDIGFPRPELDVFSRHRKRRRRVGRQRHPDWSHGHRSGSVYKHEQWLYIQSHGYRSHWDLDHW